MFQTHLLETTNLSSTQSNTTSQKQYNIICNNNICNIICNMYKQISYVFLTLLTIASSVCATSETSDVAVPDTNVNVEEAQQFGNAILTILLILMFVCTAIISLLFSYVQRKKDNSNLDLEENEESRWFDMYDSRNVMKSRVFM